MKSIAVKKGAAWLDTIDKKWFKKVRLADIDLELFEGCVVGQVFGSNVSEVLCDCTEFSYTHGFALKNGSRSNYLNLSSEWAKEIEERKK